MNVKTYQRIYQELESHDDISTVSKKYSVSISTISSISHQKTVRNVKKYHSRVVQKAPLMVRSWHKGKTILELARQNRFPPVLIASIILKEMGLKSKSVIKNPAILSNKRLKEEVIQAIVHDMDFSPQGHEVQSRLGDLGEELIHNWLTDHDLDFLTESDLNKELNAKTPDFLLKNSIDIDGSTVNWIESKAVFADETEHNRYQKKQLGFYEELFGPGMVVYWYGYLDTISPNNYLIVDHTFFEQMGYDLDRLLNHVMVQ
ncbi:MAG: C15orf41 family protein [ANME-2 cluster archaeon]|nr:C15orf41 family protein [ANME-2 cluster archaeon]